MNLYLDSFPKELVGGLKHSNVKNELIPVMEIPNFNGNLACLFALISEFFLFVVRTNADLDTHLNDVVYTVDVPANPLGYWEKKYPKLDLKKYDWFRYWGTLERKNIAQYRKTLIDLLSNNGLITVCADESSALYKITFLPYPQLEGLKQIQSKIVGLMDDTGTNLFGLSDSADSLSMYHLRKGLSDAGYIPYSIGYTFGSEVILNNKYLISKLNYSSPNDLFFEYIFQHPNKKISREQLEGVLGVFNRPLSKLVYDIGFSGELKKLFFPKVSNNSVFFNNPVTRDDLLTIEIDEDMLLEQVKGLKTIHSDTV